MFLFKNFSCPYCQADSLRNSRTRLIDWPLMLLGFMPYRCLGCSNRYHIFFPSRFRDSYD